MTDRIGQQLGNYRLIRILGKGGFAEVFLGQHIHINLQVAIKILHTRLAEDFQVEFLKEADFIAHLRHPHIIRIMDFGIEGDTPYIIMDYAPQGTLRTRHPRGSRVPIETVVSYTKQIATALQYAHDHKLIHRDIKPGNLLIGEAGEIVLSDFGLASIASSTTSIETGVYAGTLPYSAPEQILGKPRRESDQYSLGVVVYEWLSGEHPFRGTTMEIISQHLSAPPRPLQGNVPGISPEVENVVMKVLLKEPRQRFSSVQDFASALEQASQSTNVPINQVPVSILQANQEPQAEELPFVDIAKPGANQKLPQNMPEPLSEMMPLSKSVAPFDTPATPLSRPRNVSRRRLVLGFGLGGLVVASGGLIKLLSSRTAQITPSPTPTIAHSPVPTVIHSPTPTPVPIPRGTLLYLYKGHTDFVNAVAWSPDGMRIASGGYDKTVQVWDASTGGNVYTYAGHTSTVWSIAWSPGGKRIVSGSGNLYSNGGDNSVQVWDAVDGSKVFKYTKQTGTIYAVAWSPNERHIASGSGDYKVQVWNVNNGDTINTYSAHTNIVDAVAWSPDGNRIASAGWDQAVQVWDAVYGGNVIKYQGHSDIVYAVAWSPDGKRIASGAQDKTVQIWDASASNANIVYKYTGHSDAVNGVAWSPDGKRIASGSWDRTVQIWDAFSGNLIHKYLGHTDSVFAVAWSPDGKRIASASVDKTVQVWWVG